MSRKLPGHRWGLTGEVKQWFLYRCQRCRCTTLNGWPLEPPYDEECAS